MTVLDHMKVAPFNSCISCYRGDTDTFFAICGGPNWHAAALIGLLGFSPKEATATVQAALDEGQPATDVSFIRLCSACGGKHGVQVAKPPETLACYGNVGGADQSRGGRP